MGKGNLMKTIINMILIKKQELLKKENIPEISNKMGPPAIIQD
jgi:hypothetical protein